MWVGRVGAPCLSSCPWRENQAASSLCRWGVWDGGVDRAQLWGLLGRGGRGPCSRTKGPRTPAMEPRAGREQTPQCGALRPASPLPLGCSCISSTGTRWAPNCPDWGSNHSGGDTGGPFLSHPVPALGPPWVTAPLALSRARPSRVCAVELLESYYSECSGRDVGSS